MRHADVVLNHHVLNEYGRMTLISWSGGPIMRGGAIGTESGCCCGPPPPTGCNCSGSAIALPRQVSVTIDIGNATFNNSTCTDQGFRDLINGTYILDFFGVAAGTIAYLFDGFPGVVLSWSCNGAFDSEVGFVDCNLDRCYQRIYSQITLASPNDQNNPYWLAPLCSLETNEPYTAVVEHAADRDYPPSFDTDRTFCDENGIFPTGTYEATFTIEPIW